VSVGTVTFQRSTALLLVFVKEVYFLRFYLLFSLTESWIKLRAQMSVAIYQLRVAAFFLHTDDILLIAPSVSGLQVLLNACEEELSDLDMFINQKNQCVFDLVSALLRNVRNSSLLAVNVSDGLIDVVTQVCTSLLNAPLGVALMMPNVDSLGRLTPFSVKRAVVHPNR